MPFDDGETWYVHTPLGRRGNDALARVAVHRLRARYRELLREHVWWHRTLVGEYLPPVALGKSESPHLG